MKRRSAPYQLQVLFGVPLEKHLEGPSIPDAFPAFLSTIMLNMQKKKLAWKKVAAIRARRWKSIYALFLSILDENNAGLSIPREEVMYITIRTNSYLVCTQRWSSLLLRRRNYLKGKYLQNSKSAWEKYSDWIFSWFFLRRKHYLSTRKAWTVRLFGYQSCMQDPFVGESPAWALLERPFTNEQEIVGIHLLM